MDCFGRYTSWRCAVANREENLGGLSVYTKACGTESLCGVKELWKAQRSPAGLDPQDERARDRRVSHDCWTVVYKDDDLFLRFCFVRQQYFRDSTTILTILEYSNNTREHNTRKTRHLSRVYNRLFPQTLSVQLSSVSCYYNC